MNEKIRLKYPGIVNYISVLFSYVTGLIFITIITRRLSVEEFGLWSLITSLVTIFEIPLVIISYWEVRSIARGSKEAFATGILAILIFLPFMSSGYLYVAGLYAKHLGWGYEYLSFSLLILLSFCVFHQALTACRALAPQYYGYALIIAEIVKVILAFIFLVYWNIGLIGALLINSIYHLSQGMVILSLLLMNFKEFFKFKPKLELLKNWLKTFWIPLTNLLPTYIRGSIPSIVGAIVRSTLPLAYYQASSTITVPIAHSDMLASALYPRLLKEPRGEDVEEIFRLIMFVALPLFIFVIVMSVPLLSLLNPKYTVAYPIVWCMAFFFFLLLLLTLFSTIAMGTERVDIKPSSLKDYLKSKLMLINLLFVIKEIITLTVLVMLLNFIKKDEVSQAFAIPLSLLISSFVVIKPLYDLSKKDINWNFPIKNSIIYLFSSVLSSVFLISLKANQMIFKSIREEPLSLIYLLIYILIYLITYISTCLIFDSWTRKFLKSIFNQFRNYIFKFCSYYN